MEPIFKIKDRVRIKTDTSRRGRIMDIKPVGESFDCLVFLSGDEELWFSQSSLELVPDHNLRWSRRKRFLTDLLLVKLSNPLTDSLYAYRASRTIFEPYQFRPALKFMRSVEQRILIADEVGLGKTIEAAIIYLELKARLNISRVLVLCPSRLRKKWQDEMQNRFEEQFSILDANGVRRLFDDYQRFGNQAAFRAIVSFETLRRDEFIDAFSKQQIPIDLLIIDEAHHMRNAGTLTYGIGSALTDNSDAAVFLTATPLHLGNRDLFNLLNLLAPADFSDQHLFEEQVRPNLHINAASHLLATGEWSRAKQELRRVEKTLLKDRFIGNPYYREVLHLLDEPQRDLGYRTRLQRKLLELNTLSSVMTRTRKREVAHAAVRAPHTLIVEFTPEEEAFYNGVLNKVRKELEQTGHGAPGFAILAKERQAASCLIATREAFLETVQKRGPTYLHTERSEFDLAEEDDDGDTKISTENELLGLARQIGDRDTKYDLFSATLRKALAESKDSKALVFSTFRRTLNYLLRRLQNEGYEVDVIHGDVKIASRQQTIDQFRVDKKFRVLLSSEVGAEGLDFQFCDVLVNYDLPWNPMQIEQRIGRLDRFGQEHERIRIYNFYIADSIESRIFQRLYDRIHLFQQSIGDLEAILGEEIRTLSRRVLQANLTPEEEILVADEAAKRIVRRQMEEDEFEEQKDELLGQEVIFSQQVKDTVKSGRVIHPQEVSAMVETFLQEKFPKVEFTRDQDEPCWTLTISEDLAAHMQPYVLQSAKYQMGVRFKEALGHFERLALTFDSEYARERPLLEFVTWQHVLAKAAYDYWKRKRDEEVGIPAQHVVLEGPSEETGMAYFFIYALDEHGVDRKRTLEPLVILDDHWIAEETTNTLLGQLHNAHPVPTELEHDDQRYLEAQTIANEWIAKKRNVLENDLRLRNEALIQARSASIRASFDAKIKRTQQLLSQAADPRIQRLRSGEIRNLEAKCSAKLYEIERTREVTASYACVAVGRALIIERTTAENASAKQVAEDKN